MPDLTITAVTFSPPILKGKAGASGDSGSPWTEIKIDLHNHSSETTFFAYSDIGGFRYDPDIATIELVLGKLPLLADQHLTGHREPRILPVLPGETSSISVSLPVQVNGIQFHETGVPSLHKIDISAVRRIKLSIAHDRTPFRAVPTDHPHEIQQQLINWGTRLEHFCEVFIPTRDADVGCRE